MVKQSESVGHSELVGEGQTTRHSHPGGGNGTDYKAGSESITSAGDYPITFSTPFSDANYSIVLTPSSTAKDPSVTWKSKAASGFTIEAAQRGGGGFVAFTCDWVAIPHNDP